MDLGGTAAGGAALAAFLVAAAAGSAAPPLTVPGVYLPNDYNTRVVGQRGIGVGEAVNAGDVNGDGVTDALVSAPGRRSIVYIVYGRRSWRRTVALQSLTAEQGYKLVTDADVQVSLPVADAGDVNGDGIPDQVLGIPNQDGRVFVVYGQRPGRDVDLDRLQPSEGYVIEGAPGDLAGTDVANAGDVNGDGIPDQLIGAVQGFGDPGRAYVVYGQRPSRILDLALLKPDEGYRMDGGQFDQAGNSVAGAGDVNEDGVPDALVGGMSADHAYVVYGQRTATPETVDLGVPGSWGYAMQGVPLTLTGSSVDDAGDVNGDGLPDALVGAPSCQAEAPPVSAVYVVYGQRTPPAQPIGLDEGLSPQLGYRIVYTSTDVSRCAGISVAGMPDVNGDGVPDQLTGAIGASWAGGAGAAYVVYGQRTASPQLVDLVKLRPAEGYRIGGLPQAQTGWNVADAGDVDGNGEDAWVSSPNYSPTPTSVGALFLVGAPQPAATPLPGTSRVSGGRVGIRVGCSALPGRTCGGALALRRTVTGQPLAGARFAVAAGSVRVVRVPLTRAGLRLVRRLRRVRATATVRTARQRPATEAIRRAHVVVRAP